jgi:microcin C transport system permease protein
VKRIQRFKSIKRGYYSFLIITTLFTMSFFLELMVNNKPLVIGYKGKFAFPAVADWLDNMIFFAKIPSFEKREDFGQIGKSEVKYRLFVKRSGDPEKYKREIEETEQALAKQKTALKDMRADAKTEAWEIQSLEQSIAREEKKIVAHWEAYKVFTEGTAFAIMPIYPYSFKEHLLEELPANPPVKPYSAHPLGTDDSGKDVLPQLLYGFRISLLFAVIVATIGYSVGVIVGGIMGYFGGWTDILVQRFIEIWGSIPFLFTIMILADAITPNFIMLIILLVILRSWLGITYTIRGEFYREKAKDYVQAAIAMGASDWKVMTRHILPNSLVPVVSFAPFGMVAYVKSLVMLDYLGFGLPISMPSWGRMLGQGTEHLRNYPHLILTPVIALGLTLFAVVMIGEAVREAFDPKVFSRLR